MIPRTPADTMKMQALIKALVDLLDVDDIADGCYEELPIMAADPYTGKTYRIIDVVSHNDEIGPHIVLMEA